MKATSLFGGVQVFNIFIAVIRSKFIAVLLGPAGMGIAGLISATTGIIGGLTNFGLGTSAVKDVASANGSGNSVRIATVVTVFRRLVWITGTLGFIITLILSPWLSQLTFGNRNYTLAFAFVSITLLLNQLSSGQMVILQGMRKLKNLAKADVIGSVAGLLITIPLYYIYGVDAIVPAIIVTSCILLTLSWYFAQKIKIDTIKVSRYETITEGKGMITMGIMISLSGLIGLGASYIIRIYISNKGGIADVGLYNAGFSIINTYVGLIFNAMATDYFPRLSAVAHNNVQSKAVINQQTEIAILILAPIVIVFLVFIQLIVIVLYSNKFVAVDTMIHWAALGMLFKATSWPLGFFVLAKGVNKWYIWNVLSFEVLFLFINIFGYKFGGLTGLGISYVLGYLISTIHGIILCRIWYKIPFPFTSEVIHIFGIQFSFALTSFIVVKYLSNPYSYIIGTVIIGISTWYSVKELDKRIELKTIIINLLNKYKK